jgi:hypothetical protein
MGREISLTFCPCFARSTACLCRSDIPESDADTRDGVTGDLVSSKGKDEVHPERALKQAAAAAKKEKVDLDEKTMRQGGGTGNTPTNGHGHMSGHGNVNGLRVKGDE